MSTKLIDREAIMKEFDRLIRPCTINRRRLIEAAHSPLFLQQLHIAIIALNEGTEVSDFLSAYGVLVESGVADVTVVADRTDPIRLYPSIRAAPQATTAQFDASRPEGADYVVVPAMIRTTIRPSSPGSRRSIGRPRRSFRSATAR